MQSVPSRVSFGAILLAIQARLVWATGLPKTSVKLIGRQEQVATKSIGDKDVLVRPSRFSSRQGTELAAGRITIILERAVYVFSRVRMIRDETGRDDLWLTHPTDSIFALEETVLNGLQEWFPTDQSVSNPTDMDGNPLVIRGLNITDGQAPEKFIKTDPSWGDSCIAFAVQYLPPIDPGPHGIGV